MPRRDSLYAWPWSKVRAQILARDGYRCQVQGPTCTGVGTSVDHIVPLSRGGARLDPGNLRAACSGCQQWLTVETRRLIATGMLGVEPRSESW